MSSDHETIPASGTTVTAATHLVMQRHHLSVGDATAHVHRMAEESGVADDDLAPLLISSYDESTTRD
jgi:hypothetical protein